MLLSMMLQPRLGLAGAEVEKILLGASGQELLGTDDEMFTFLEYQLAVSAPRF